MATVSNASKAKASRARGAVRDISADEAERARGLSVTQLLSAVENELIPRLLVAHAEEVRAAAEPPEITPEPPPAGQWAAPEEIERFARWSAAGESERLREHVSALLSRDISLDAVYLHLFAPVARHLGEQWTRDEVSFVDVQLGLSQLHRLVCECGPVGHRYRHEDRQRSIMLTVAPGEQHTFGVTLAADFFRRHGWQVSNLCGHDYDFVVERVAATRYTAVGFSLYGEASLSRLGRAVAEVRRRSCNPDLLVLVGGDFFARNPEAISEVGADLSASDAHRAVFAAERALERVAAAAGTPAAGTPAAGTPAAGTPAAGMPGRPPPECLTERMIPTVYTPCRPAVHGAPRNAGLDRLEARRR